MANQLTQQHIDHNTKLLIQVSSLGNTDEVKRLIPVSNPKADNSYALRLAASKGHTECVKLLLSVSDPKARESAALRWAAEHRYTDIVKLLLPVSDCLKAEQEMKNQCVDATFLRQHIDEYEVLLQKERLIKKLKNTVNNKQYSSVKRKI